MIEHESPALLPALQWRAGQCSSQTAYRGGLTAYVVDNGDAAPWAVQCRLIPMAEGTASTVAEAKIQAEAAIQRAMDAIVAGDPQQTQIGSYRLRAGDRP